MLPFVFSLHSNPHGGFCLHHVHCEETESQSLVVKAETDAWAARVQRALAMAG